MINKLLNKKNMKKIIIIVVIAFTGSFAFAQSMSAPSSVYDVPLNKKKTAYDNQSATTTTEPVKKVIINAPVKAKVQESSVSSINDNLVPAPSKKQIADNSGSVSDVAPAKTTAKKADVSGSVLDTPAAKPADKKLDTDGSIAPVTEKKVEPKVLPTDSKNSTNNALVVPAPSKQINYVTPLVNNTKPVEVPVQKVENPKDNNVPAAKPLIGNPVQINAELLKENPKGNE